MLGGNAYGTCRTGYLSALVCVFVAWLGGCAQVDPIDMSRKISADASTAIQPISDKILAGGDVVQRKEVNLQPPKPANPGLGWGLLGVASVGSGLACVMVGKLIRKHAGLSVSCDSSKPVTPPQSNGVGWWERPDKS